MTPRQKRIIGILAVANVIVILALFMLLVHPGTLSSPLPTPTYDSSMFSPEICQWRATQKLAKAGLSGKAVLTNGKTLQIEITQPLAVEQPTEEAAQQVWIAFDVAQYLLENQCDRFSQIDVTILAQGNHGKNRIEASVSSADLKAFDAGKLSEEAFIDRVTYTAAPLP